MNNSISELNFNSNKVYLFRAESNIYLLYNNKLYAIYEINVDDKLVRIRLTNDTYLDLLSKNYVYCYETILVKDNLYRSIDPILRYNYEYLTLDIHVFEDLVKIDLLTEIPIPSNYHLDLLANFRIELEEV